MAKISIILSREILDSRSNPTIETACVLDDGKVYIASVPSGASTGTHEALELRDKDPKRYNGKGVLKAINNVNSILGPAVVGMDPTDQRAIDLKLVTLDGTSNKTKYGANAILSISFAVAKAGANVQNIPLYLWIYNLAKASGIVPKIHIPTPLFNMINGGLHGAGNLDFQEFHVIPASSKKFYQGIQMGVEIYQIIGKNLARRGAIHSVGDEGGYAPNLFTNADALEVFVEAIQETHYEIGRDVFLGLDVAADSFYKNGEYLIRDNSSPMDDRALTEYFKNLNEKYKLSYLEDPFAEDDWEAWIKLTASLSSQLTVVGDDLLVTNPNRVAMAIEKKACSGILVKPNQIGTVSEALEVIKKARDAGWKVIVSHRSGETNDYFIADFAVGVGADFAKFGAPARGERVAKYNRLSAIEIELNASKK